MRYLGEALSWDLVNFEDLPEDLEDQPHPHVYDHSRIRGLVLLTYVDLFPQREPPYRIYPDTEIEDRHQISVRYLSPDRSIRRNLLHGEEWRTSGHAVEILIELPENSRIIVATRIDPIALLQEVRHIRKEFKEFKAVVEETKDLVEGLDQELLGKLRRELERRNG